MTTNPLRVQRSGPPEPRSTTQREIVLDLLRAAGKAGINRDHFLMGTGPCVGHRFTQVGARLDELEEEGFVFESFKANETDRFVTYRLLSEPVVRKERPAFREKKRKKDAPRHVDAITKAFGPDCIGVNVYSEADGKAVHLGTITRTEGAETPLAEYRSSDVKQEGHGAQPTLFADSPAPYRDPESQT